MLTMKSPRASLTFRKKINLRQEALKAMLSLNANTLVVTYHFKGIFLSYSARSKKLLLVLPGDKGFQTEFTLNDVKEAVIFFRSFCAHLTSDEFLSCLRKLNETCDFLSLALKTHKITFESLDLKTHKVELGHKIKSLPVGMTLSCALEVNKPPFKFLIPVHITPHAFDFSQVDLSLSILSSLEEAITGVLLHQPNCVIQDFHLVIYGLVFEELHFRVPLGISFSEIRKVSLEEWLNKLEEGLAREEINLSKV